VFGDARRAVIVIGAAMFTAGIAVGFVVGRAGRDEAPVAAAADPSPSASPAASAAGSPAVVTPSPGQAPAITTQGQVLLEGDRPVVAAPVGAACQSLVSAGALGECGEVPVAAGRVVWVVERSATTTGATALRARLFTFVPDAGGWVEWLQAADPTGERWSDVNVLPADLTGDGVPELVVGFRGADELQTLEYDIVGYAQDGLPTVLAHPEPPSRGVVVVSAGQVQEYAAQYPNAEPACCPPSYIRRTIGYDAGFFREIAADTVTPNVVPASQL
jgi:hypothetical protein